MKCPNCEHVSDTALLKCSSCGEMYDRATLEKFQHLEFLRAWLDDHVVELGEAHARLRDDALAQLNVARAAMGLPARSAEQILAPQTPPRAIAAPVSVGAPAEIARELVFVENTLKAIDSWVQARLLNSYSAGHFRQHLNAQMQSLRAERAKYPETFPPPADFETLDYILDSLDAWVTNSLIPSAEAENLRARMRDRRATFAPRAPSPASQPAPARAEPRAALTPPVSPVPIPTPAQTISAQPLAPARKISPPAAPTPAAPPFDWGKFGARIVELAVSGALLRGLLYLGAFMIVVSAIILTVVYWKDFPPFLRNALIVALPVTFYVGGFFLRTRLNIPVAGGVITGIGALLVAVDFVALYQLGDLEIDTNLYWLIASLVSTAVYVFTAYRIPGEFFGYITWTGVSSTVLALTQVLRVSLDWSFALTTASAAPMVQFAARAKLNARWDDLVRAARRYPIALALIFQVLVLFVPGNAVWGQAGTFLAAMLVYALFAARFPRVWFAYAAIGSSFVGAILGARASALPVEWYGAGLALFAAFYFAAYFFATARLATDLKERDKYLIGLEIAAFGALALAAIAGLFALTVNVWTGAFALALVSLLLVFCALAFQQPNFAFAASALFIVPYSAALVRALTDARVLQANAWMIAAWALLALAYVFSAIRLRAKKEYARGLYATAHALMPLGLVGLLLNYSASPRDGFAGPSLAALGGIIFIYLFSAILHDRGDQPALASLVKEISPAAFLYPIGFLLPIWIALLWDALPLNAAWLSAVMAALALSYVGSGLLLARRKIQYRLPLHAYAYLLSAVAVLISFRDAWAQLATLYLIVAVLAALAFIYRRAIETTLAALVFLWAFYLSLLKSPLEPHAYSLGFALVASLVYIPLAVRLEKIARQFAIPIFIIGYLVAAFAVLASLAGRYNAYPLNVEWIGVVVPLIVAGVLVYSAYHFNRRAFGFATIIVVSLASAQMQALLKLPAAYEATAWVGLAFAYLLIERALNRVREKEWLANFRQPLQLGALFFWAAGLILTLNDTVRALAGARLDDYAAPILAQTLAVGLTMVAAILYGRRVPLWIEPFLAFFPLTLFLHGFTVLNVSQYALAWMALGAAHVVAGFLFDRVQTRYSHALHLGGYALATFALVWSFGETATNVAALAGAIILALVSQLLAHFGRHRAFAEFHGAIWRASETAAARGARTIFLFIAAFAFPLGLYQLLTLNNVELAWRGFQLLTLNNVELAWRGFALAATAPIFLALALVLRRARAEYAWPFYGAAYALTAIGALLAFDNELIAIYVLAFDAAVYFASAYVFRQAFWLYIANALVPIIALVALHYNQLLFTNNVAGILMGLAFVDVLIGFVFDRRARAETRAVGAFALPFFSLGYFISALALAVSSGDKFIALATFSAGVILYALSAFFFRESVFLYPAAWLAAVPYWIAITLTALPHEWYGVAWTPFIVALIALGKLAFHRAPIRAHPSIVEMFAHPALPFYILAYALSAHLLAYSLGSGEPRAAAGWVAAILYFASAALFRRAFWLYPALLIAHLAIIFTLALIPSDNPPYFISLPMAGVTWVVALVGLVISRKAQMASRPSQASFKSFFHLPLYKNLFTPAWSQPFFIFAALDVFLWQVVALNGNETWAPVAAAFAILCALVAMVWRDPSLAYGAIGFFVLAVSNVIAQFKIAFPDGAAILGGIGFAFYLLSRLLEIAVKNESARLRVWVMPLARAAIAFTALAILFTLPTIGTLTTASAASLAFGGALYIALAYRGAYARLGYFGAALLEIAWVLVLSSGNVTQPQFYAIPAGVYFTLVGFFERRRGNAQFAALLEIFGLAVLLLTSFVQSLNGAAGFPYFILLLIEGVLVIAWGAARRLRVPFFIGIAASVLNVVAQVAVLINVYDVNRFFIIFGVGVLLVISAVFVERQRARIIAKAQEWREGLEEWG